MKRLTGFLFFLLLAVSLIFTEERHISPVFSFGGLDDSTSFILNGPADLLVTEENIYIVDKSDHNIVISDKSGNLIKRIGRLGNGPLEFNAPVTMAIIDDNLVVYDAGNQRIQVISRDDKCLKTYPAVTLGQFGAGFLFSKDNTYYYSTEGYSSDYLLVHKTFEGKELGGFGQIYGEKTNYVKFEVDKVKRGNLPDYLKNRIAPIKDSNENVYCIHIALPLVKKFGSNGKLIWEKELDIPEFKIIKENWILENKKSPPNVAIRLEFWRDVKIDRNDNIYLQVAISDEMIVYVLNTEGNILMKYVGDEKKIKLIDIYKNALWALDGENHVFYKYILNE